MNCPYCIKKCSKCGKLLVANTMNFRKKKDGKYGLRSRCKRCMSIENKEHYENNKEHYKEYMKGWRENNPDKVFNNRNKRRQLEENQGGGISKNQWLEVMEFFDWKCAYSGIMLDKNARTIDHITPLSKGGEHEIWNCVPMYKPYNSSKNTSDMLEWYQQQEFYSDERLNRIYEWIEYAKNKWENSNK